MGDITVSYNAFEFIECSWGWLQLCSILGVRYVLIHHWYKWPKRTYPIFSLEPLTRKQRLEMNELYNRHLR